MKKRERETVAAELTKLANRLMTIDTDAREKAADSLAAMPDGPLKVEALAIYANEWAILEARDIGRAIERIVAWDMTTRSERKRTRART